MDDNDEFSINDLRKLDDETIKKDINNRGYDLENCKIRGVDASYLILTEKDFYPRQKLWIYVKLEDHSFLFSKRPEERQPKLAGQRTGKTLSHSLLARGKPVIGAGECETDENNKIIRVNNQSGHYKPLFKNLRESIKNMKEKDLVTEKTEYFLIEGNTERRIEC
jgi:hypothetical protein